MSYVDPTQAAKDIVAWMKAQDQAQPGRSFGYDDISSEIRRRYTDMPFRDVKFITEKAIRILCLR
jgi:hypothetical protein